VQASQVHLMRSANVIKQALLQGCHGLLVDGRDVFMYAQLSTINLSNKQIA
jgi:hypothetical protein